MRPSHSPHPWWSRALYLLYGLVTGAGGVYAWMQDQTQLALVAGGIAALLIWKAAQRVR